MTVGGFKWARGPLLLVLMLALPALACQIPEFSEVPGIPGVVEPTPVGSPTPMGDSISFLAPAYATNLQPGESVPGTKLTYLGNVDGGYEVSLDGQPAVKRTGDSFYWSGVIAPGVFANYKLRLTRGFFGGMPVLGPVELVVLFPKPEPLPLNGDPEADFHLGNIVIDYHVPLNRNVPGTTLTYDGLETQGLGDQSSSLAKIGGMSGYNKLAVGDSLVWTGLIRDNVAIRYNLRAISFDEENIRFVGTGELWIKG